jgi:outer membrane protein assembly factor BamB
MAIQGSHFTGDEPGEQSMRGNQQTVFIGIKGTVLALDRASGEEVWRAPLKGSSFVNLVLDGGVVMASTHGEVFCLDPATGAILWNNPLRGMGYGLVAFAGSAIAVTAEEQRRRAAAAAASSGSAGTM